MTVSDGETSTPYPPPRMFRVRAWIHKTIPHNNYILYETIPGGGRDGAVIALKLNFTNLLKIHVQML